MKKIGMVGSQLIHTYAYAMHFNKFDLAYAQEAPTAPKWQVQLMADNPDVQPLGGAEITHVCGGLENVPEDMAKVFGLTVTETEEELFEAVDLVMVMDEQIPSRSKLIRKALEAGKTVFADKLLSDNLATATELIDLAKEKGVMVAAWSQQGFCSEYEAVKELGPGGTAFISFAMKPEILKMYGIHVISTVQGCFPGKFKNFKILTTGNEKKICYMEDEKGTNIIFGASTDFPGGCSRVDYCAGGKSIVIESKNKFVAFREAAKSIIGMTEGKAPKFDMDDLKEASRILEEMCK